MEYHSDQFTDNSLLVYKKEKLVALLPANKSDGTVFSHQGLTYGGLVLPKKIKFEETAATFKAVLAHLESEGVKELILKTLPGFYSVYPSEEIDYLLFVTEAKRFRTDVSSVIPLKVRLAIQGNRLEGVKKGEKLGVEVKEDSNFKDFWNEILIPNLEVRHAAAPVHSLAEITKLAATFPKNIHQFNVYHKGVIVAGATIFETHTTAHVQYISANAERQQLGSLDVLFQYLIEERFTDKLYFDFGTSNENQGQNVNKGLLYWKETFGARTLCCHHYRLSTVNHSKLDTVFI